MTKYLSAEDPELLRAWGELARITGSPDSFPVGDTAMESWEYMGTDDDGHSFRHRALPVRALLSRTPFVVDLLARPAAHFVFPGNGIKAHAMQTEADGRRRVYVLVPAEVAR